MAIYSIIHKEVILYETVFGGINLNFLLTNIEFTLKANLWKNSGDQELINFAKIFTFDNILHPIGPFPTRICIIKRWNEKAIYRIY